MENSVDTKALVAMILLSVEPTYARDHKDNTPYKIIMTTLRGEQFEAHSAMRAVRYGAAETVTLSAADRVQFVQTFGEVGLQRWDDRKFSRTAFFTVPMDLFNHYTMTDREAAYTPQDREAAENVRGILGFATLYAYRHGTRWYIVDNTEGGSPYRDSIGGYFDTYAAAYEYAWENYREDYA